MKLLLSILLIFLSTLFCKKTDFEIVEATKQDWTGGFRGSGYGTNYVIKTVANHSSKTLKIDQLWVGNKKFDAVAITGYYLPFDKQDTNFRKKDTVYLLAFFVQKVDRTGNPVEEDNETKKILPPIKYDGDALVGYRVNKKRKYMVIKSIKELEALNYP
ncbi:MAG: hypothetical protein K9J13_15465 [Saprospiraceae bacterium]|nr:hypothetical protein [Saprospiraceae bacterium]